jgi:hypothetical protein
MADKTLGVAPRDIGSILQPREIHVHFGLVGGVDVTARVIGAVVSVDNGPESLGDWLG